MALSYNQWTGDGVTQTFPLDFPYLDKANITASVNLLPVAYTWDSDSVIRISPAPANGLVVEARRRTERETRLVDFSDGSTLTESDLDLSATQVFYIVQEAIDIAGGTLELLSDGSYGAGGRRIREMADPVDPQDAATKAWVEGAVTSPVATAIAQATIATQQAAAALASKVLSGEYATASGESATASATSAGTATTQAGLAAAAKTAAEAARDLALSYRDSALTYRNQAETFKNDAAASAAAAAVFVPANYVTATQHAADIAAAIAKARGPTFSAKMSTNQAIPNGVNTKVNFDTEEFDVGNCYDPVLYRFTPNMMGYYLITVGIVIVAGAYTSAIVAKNGAAWKMSNFGVGGEPYSTETTAIVYCNGTTDYIEGWALTSAAGRSLVASANSAFFQGCMVRGV